MDVATRERRTPRRMMAMFATLGLISGLFVITASAASAVGPITLTPSSGDIAPDGSLDVVVKNTDPKKSTSALIATVALDPSDAPFSITNGCQGVALGKNKTCTVTIAYTAASAPAANQTATLSVVSKKPGVAAQVTGVYTVRRQTQVQVGCPSNNLQAAIDAAVAGDTINISGTCIGNFSIGKDLTLVGVAGTSPTLDGNDAGSVLTIGSGASVTITDLTITNGTAPAFPGDGGGIYNSGTLTLNNSTVSGSTANSTGGGIYNLHSTVTLTGSTVSGNTASGAGGGIANQGGTVTLNNSTVSGNAAGLQGGGILNFNGVVPGTLTLNDSTVSGNASARGGGISNDTGTVTLNNSTVSGNQASDGGGIYVFLGTVILNDSTVSGNTAFSSGGGYFSFDGTLTLNGSSSVSGNIPDDIVNL